MKKLAILTLVSVLGFSLAACSTHKMSPGAKVKCPACGYEFPIPEQTGN
jgi:hypothetical protein